MNIRKILLSTAALGALAGYMIVRPRMLVRRLALSSPDVLFSVDTTERVVALTIDDGPHAVLTPMILDTLAEYGVHATFFLLGEHIPGNEAIVQRIVAEGHELGNHTMIDAPSIRFSEDEFAAQLAQADALLSQFSQVRWFRPGSGWYNQRLLRQVKERDYRCVVGSVYPYDAQLRLTPVLSAYILANAFPGAIIALHDGTWERRRTVDVLRQTLPRLQARGYRIVTLSELVAVDEEAQSKTKDQ
jgi:peptidoglycan/xylan/chitin deacetylase (PgdA/CDA1 family)